MPTSVREEEKLELIRTILDNPVYVYESGLIQNLKKALLKLSLNDLQNLQLIISMSR